MTGAYRGVPRVRRPFAAQAPDVVAADITRLVERRALDVEPTPTAEDETVARLLARRAVGVSPGHETPAVDDPVSRLLARRTAGEVATEPVDDPVSRLLARRRGEE